jgi:hypothetical protein
MVAQTIKTLQLMSCMNMLWCDSVLLLCTDNIGMIQYRLEVLYDMHA